MAATTHSLPPVFLGSATLDQLKDMAPYSVSAVLRAAVADRCMRTGKAQFAEAKKAREAGRIEYADEIHEWGKEWMRERQRWLPPAAQADSPTPADADQTACTGSPAAQVTAPAVAGVPGSAGGTTSGRRGRLQ